LTHAAARADQGSAGSAKLRAVDPRLLRRVGGVSAIATCFIMLLGAAALALGLRGLGLRPWLLVMFQMNAGIGSLPADPLRVFNPLDVIMLVLTGLTILGTWSIISRSSRVWFPISVVLPFAGIAVLITTHLAGRSAVMGAGIVVAVFLTRTSDLKGLGYLGMCANGLLLVGDFATGDARAPLVAAIMAIGYVLLIAWFALVGVRLLGSSEREVG
jgi:hypothetical protein